MPQPAIEIRFTGLKKFDRAVKNFNKKIVPGAHLKFQKKLAIELLSRIIDKNPVGNPDLWKGPAPKGYVGGRSRSNWQVAVTQPPETSVTGIDASGGSALTAGLGHLATSKPFGTVWIFNNVRYITALEEGHSSQAPAGMVAVSLAEIEAFFKKGE